MLNRVASLFRRRAFNIESLTVGHTETKGVSRMTIVVDTDTNGARRLEANLYKLVNVLRVTDLTFEAVVARELTLVRVAANHETRIQVMQLVDTFRARVVDMTTDSLKIDGLMGVLEPYGVLEMVRTGRVAMSRGLQDKARGPNADDVTSSETDDNVSHSV